MPSTVRELLKAKALQIAHNPHMMGPDPFHAKNPEALLDSLAQSGVGLWELNVATEKAYWSRWMFLLFEIDPTPDGHVKFTDFLAKIYEEDRQRTMDLTKASIAAGSGCWSDTYRIQWADGTIVMVRGNYEAITDEDGSVRLVGTLADVTELWRMQQAKEEHLLLKKSLEEERKRRDEVQRLLRTMSHEIRNPLQGILSNTTQLLEAIGGSTFSARSLSSSGKPKDYMSGSNMGDKANLVAVDAMTTRACLEETLECALHQLMVVNDFLDYEVVRCRDRVVRSDPVDVVAVAHAVAKMFKTAARDKALKLVVAEVSDVTAPATVTTGAAESGPLVILGDETLLKRIMMNLVSNAIKFADNGTITVTLEHDGSGLKMSVADHGKGIPAEFRDQLFKTAGLTTTNSNYVAGSGLGLCICRMLAEDMKGEMGFSDNIPKGTIMYLSIPAKRVPADATLSDSARGRIPFHVPTQRAWRNSGDGPLAEARGAVLRGRRILVAEDNRINQRVLTHMLKNNCKELVVVGDGVEAVEHFVQSGPFDVVLLDVHMPNLDGKAAAAQIRQLNADVSIIFLTGEMVSEMTDVVDRIGHCSCLLKPASLDDINEACEHLFKLSPQPVERTASDAAVAADGIASTASLSPQRVPRPPGPASPKPSRETGRGLALRGKRWGLHFRRGNK